MSKAFYKQAKRDSQESLLDNVSLAAAYAHNVANRLISVKGKTSPAVLVTAYRPSPDHWSADFTRLVK